jgi:hypothetical protein
LSEAFSGTCSLKINFEGTENSSFSHLYQIVPVDPLTPYRLTYGWRSKNITTDQGPFVDIYGYDCNGVSFKGPMMLGTHPWQEQVMEFTVPQACHAVVQGSEVQGAELIFQRTEILKKTMDKGV